MRLIDKNGSQIGIVAVQEAQAMADRAGLDLVEISPNAHPPVCKIIDYGKFRYEQTKREKEQKKGSVQGKLKEVKIRPNIDEHDLNVKVNRARDFLEKGNKVKVTCMSRGREMAHPEVAARTAARFQELHAQVASVEVAPKQMGRNLSMVLAPKSKKH